MVALDKSWVKNFTMLMVIVALDKSWVKNFKLLTIIVLKIYVEWRILLMFVYCLSTVQLFHKLCFIFVDSYISLKGFGLKLVIKVNFFRNILDYILFK